MVWDPGGEELIVTIHAGLGFIGFRVYRVYRADRAYGVYRV